jgi:hypothetical protein
MGRYAGLILFLSVAGCAIAESLPPELSKFRFEGKPIHPAIINEFIPWHSDGEPVIAAVDLEGFTRSRNRLSGWTVQEKEGRVEGVAHEDGYIWYWHLGQSKSGVHLVEVLEAGGSSSWRYLLELRFEVVQAFGSRRILLRCENVQDLTCCPVRVVEGMVVFGPCERHPRPIPIAEPADIGRTGVALADPGLLRTWDSDVVLYNRMLGKIRVFPHSIFIERQGIVSFTVVAAAGPVPAPLGEEVDSSRFLLLDARSSRIPGSPTLRVAFHEGPEKGLADFTSETSSGSHWSLAEDSNN